ncbi:MAG: phosphoribosylformylglycinamidine synthase subunit PurQ [Synergistaceae bacterium]|nr:phosphoribosylformylglycinamidine synthase subunit PurQ [Synergistaceae bacterium]
MVHRIYTERKDSHNPEALSLLAEIRALKGSEGIRNIRVLSRYDVQGLTDSQLAACRDSVFSEPFTDNVLDSVPDDADYVLAVEFLPGQYDQRADSAEQCAGLLLGFRPVIRTAKVYLFYGETSDFMAVKKHLINPVEAREAQSAAYDSLSADYPVPDDVMTVDDIMSLEGLAMSREDMLCVKEYFDAEGRKPTRAEIKVLDTYWSDHCRHTTFTTHIDGAEIHDDAVSEAYVMYQDIRKELGYDSSRPVTLMDIATIGAKYLRAKGLLTDIYDSEENNACTVRINAEGESWLLLFKNETHNHPTEIEPFGGAATCIGGAIRDPLSGRAYVYQAMRITGAADPFTATIPGKLPQRTIITKAAQGYSSYGNQIGIPTGIVREIYHEGYRAKRLEVGAVVAAVKESDVIREKPSAGDIVLLLGGRTGRDGIGGATGSSVSHTASSIETCGAEVQKGNAPEERKLQRLFRNPEFTRLIKRCNDFGAGGVSVAVGELADGLDINLDAVPLKYAGLDGTEIAVSESQERMAVVISPDDEGRVKSLALSEDVEATVIARVNDSGRMRMTWRGREIVNISRSFIDTNGASRHISVKVSPPESTPPSFTALMTPPLAQRRQEASGLSSSLPRGEAKGGHLLPREDTGGYSSASGEQKGGHVFPECLADLNACSGRGLSERFDSTVGGRTVLMPFGGKYQKTPVMAMCAKIPAMRETDTCSLMSWGFDPYLSEQSPFEGAYVAVLEALCRVAASGGDMSHCWLTLQEYFGKPENDPARWGLPFGALLGALKAQVDYGVAAIGGKDSMSGTFTGADGRRLDVPPTLIAFAVSVADVKRAMSPEFKRSGSRVIVLKPEYDSRCLPVKESMLGIFADIRAMNEQGKIRACSLVSGNIESEIFRMCLGNNLGFMFTGNVTEYGCGVFLVEVADDLAVSYPELGRVIDEPVMILADGRRVALSDAEAIYDAPLAEIFPASTNESAEIPSIAVKPGLPSAVYTHSPVAEPRFLIPVFAGTNCEYETARAVNMAGGKAEIFVVRSLTPEMMQESAERFAQALRESQALIIPGGFSNGDEPDGSGKFIAIFLRSPQVRSAVENLIDDRGGLVCGICNGFQALMKTGLLPHGKFMNPGDLSATLTFNRIGRHQSRIIRSVVTCNNSPWMKLTRPGEVYSVPISHGEGRFLCGEEEFTRLMMNGQVAGQYCGFDGKPSMLTEDNPSGSCFAVECITSPDGRIIGRMGHVERNGENLCRNVPGNFSMRFFEAACRYFSKL